ncbi:ABC transporter permease [Demetria terragena]|uniref:ABC transporter permease n=1 Tax=Demetria terragena TaxID=63959 RepID=UPI0003674227|nr:ABC transporter permease [Demetria terragena]
MTADPSIVTTTVEETGATKGGLRANLPTIAGIPILVVIILGCWIFWRSTTTLDDIEARILDWGNVGTLTVEHLKLTVVTSIVVLVTAIPVGIALTRPALRKLSGPVIAVANAGQAAPVIGVIVLLAMWIGFGFTTAVISLAAYSFLPVLRNTIVGLQSIDPTLVEAAQGMGMSKFAVLLRIELPMAVPIIMTGVRTTLVLVAGTAAFGTFIDAGGLGSLIKTGIELDRTSVLVSGAVLIAALALIIDWLGRLMELAATPKGMR